MIIIIFKGLLSKENFYFRFRTILTVEEYLPNEDNSFKTFYCLNGFIEI